MSGRPAGVRRDRAGHGGNGSGEGAPGGGASGARARRLPYSLSPMSLYMASVTRRARPPRWRGLCALVLAVALAGCANLEYYMQSIAGHSALLQAARPLEQVLAD